MLCPVYYLNMQTTKFKPLFNLASINKECIRTVAEATTVGKTGNAKPWKDIPGPSSLPIVGQILHFLPGGAFGNIEDPNTIKKLIDAYGPIVKLDGTFGRPPLLFLNDAKSTEFVLRNENWLPVRPGLQSLEHYRKLKDSKKGKGIDFHATRRVTDQGEVWREFRSTVSPVMLQPKTIKLYAQVLDEVAQDMIVRMKANRNEKNMIMKDFDKEMNLWALESISTVALGCRLNSFDPNLPADSPVLQLIQCVHDLFVVVHELDLKPSLWRWISTPRYKKAMKLYELHENLAKYFINKGKDNIKNKSDTEKGILEKLLNINEEAAHILATDMLIAGVDTTANTVTATLYLLAKHPEKQAKLREEIMSSSERRPYLRACIKESLRMMPVVSANARTSTKEYTILGYEVPIGVDILFTNREMSMMEEHFPRAYEYIPERWVAQKDDPLYYGNTHPFVYLPFGFGARSCLGRRIAELEMDKFVARLIENFQVEWFGPPPKTVQQALNFIKGPYNFVFKDIK